MMDTSPARDRVVTRLHEDLVGPLSPDEVLTSRPSDVYLTGILWPPRTFIGGDEDEKLEAGGGGDDADADDGEASAIASSSVQKPSVCGLSFCIAGKERPEVKISVSFAKYTPVTEEGGKKVIWTRRQSDVCVSVSCVPSVPSLIRLGESCPDAEGTELYVRTVPNGGTLLVTVSLINACQLSEEGDRDAREAATLFQTSLTAEPLGRAKLVPRPSGRGSGAPVPDAGSDEAGNDLLFRNAHEFAVGHVCAAMWGEPAQADGAVPHVPYVRTSWIPSAIVPGVSASGHSLFDRLGPSEGRPDCLSADFLARAGTDELRAALGSLCDAYAEWIGLQTAKLAGLDERYLPAANDNLARCTDVLRRLRASVDRLCGDSRLTRSFQLANLAMSVQHGWDPEKAARGPLRWRPFQLAFLLLAAPSTALRDHPDRETMDLLWFPTGGGKTEAYLGLIAFIAFFRRLSDDVADHSGVAALMRYTLRLLTTQQFARSAAMILACEVIRRGLIPVPGGDPLKGDAPFSIGLWVGGDASPNRRAQAFASLGGARELASPKQLSRCPCCQASLSWPRISVTAPVHPVCETAGCLLRGPLPVWTVDEDVYEQRPTLLVGTVDKFAQIVRRTETGMLFGLHEGSPPDLILQDELHLISGPLGTVSGLYEAAIDIMFGVRGAKVKIIGSTATIRRAPEQVRDLFDRTACQFPPPAIDQTDSGFAVLDPASPGRRYAGVTTAGRSAKFTLQAVAASLLQSAAAAFATDQDRDPYQTLVGYFNSLRELGGALVLMQDDVSDSIRLYATARSETARRSGVVEELTSRRTQDEILQMLETLAIRAGEPGCVDTVLATNMVSVGVDIPRLGLMLVNGQPKTTAEYIQATSRVGRGSVSGLVVTILNNAKARDRSHFETFTGWHGALYRDVEATSVTPFASRARDRALHAALVAAVRHLVPGMLATPQGIDDHRDRIEDLIGLIAERASRIDPEETAVRAELERKLAQWEARAPRYYWNDRAAGASLLQSAEQAARNRALGGASGSAWPTLNSMRNVEAGTPFRLAPVLKNRKDAPDGE